MDLAKGEQTTPSFTSLNPQGKVPVLEHDGFVLRESNAILCYLGTLKQNTMWPDSGPREATSLQWLFFESAHLTMQCGTVWFAEKVAPAVGIPGGDAATLETARRSAARGLDLLDAHLADRPFILGDHFTLVDCSIGATVSVVEGTSLDSDNRWPKVLEYRRRIQARASWAAADGAAVIGFGA